MLSATGLTVHYGPIAAVSDVDLEIGDGEVLALLGPSGCGKSTLLRAVAGLEPSRGRVSWDGTDLSGVPVHRRGFGLVFQDGQLFPHRDVAGNVAFGLRMRGQRSPSRVAELLALVGLDGYGKRRVASLSGGEQQRVALARALAPRPRLLLLDEPLSALDRSLREQLAIDLSRLLREAGTTALVVTHDHDEAFTLADRVAIMDRGRIRQVGRPVDVWRRPADETTARFLGCTTFTDGVVENGVLTCEFGSAPLTAADGPARIGLRPAGLRVTAGEPTAAVTGRAHRHDHVRVVADLDGRGPVDAVADVASAPEVGSRIALAVDPVGVALIGRA
jgi:thiamine transport system ATP-binding protein